MRLSRPFIRLPLRFDVDRLRAEIATFAAPDWRPHPQAHPGNSALPLVAVGGDPGNDGVAGAMAPTPHLSRAPYIRQVMAALGAPLGRSRLMQLDARAEATPHVDTNYYWLDRVRVHVPVVTRPEVEFQCGGASVHMPAGDVVARALDGGLLICTAGDHTIRLLPPLIATRDDLARGLAILEEALTT